MKISEFPPSGLVIGLLARDEALTSSLREGLSKEGFDVLLLHSAHDVPARVVALLVEVDHPTEDGARPWAAYAPTVPVIALVTDRDRDTRIALLRAGVADCVAPPVDVEELCAKLVNLTRFRKSAYAVEAERVWRVNTLERLTSGVVHDFNNRLSVILAASHLVAASGDLSREAADDLLQIQDAARHASSLMEHLVAFGRHTPLRPTLVDANEAFRTVSRILRKVVSESVDVYTHLTEARPLVRVDRAKLELALVGLIINANEAMPRGGTITLRTGRRAIEDDAQGLPRGDYVTLGVKDEGLFEARHTADPDARGRGIGLGFAEARRFIRQSGGAVEVTSTPGHGTTVTLLLPDASAASTADPTAHVAPPVTRGEATVLLVEDDPQVRVVAARILERAGYAVVVANDGHEGIAALREQGERFSLVVTDVVMPHLSGVDFARRAAEMGLTVPVLFMSAYADDTTARYGVDVRHAHHLRKPFTADALIAKVREALG
jgi:DNA-binding response OmpR family regulator